MEKGMTTGVKILITLFIALVVTGIFFYMQSYTKRGSEEYINGTSNASIPGMTLEDILNMFGGEKEEMTDFYCANAIPGMLVKDFGSCSESACMKDRVYFDDNNCDDAYDSYNQWRSDNTYVAVCLEGDGCLDMPEDQGAKTGVGQCLLVDLTKFNGNPIQLSGLMFRVDADSGGNCNNDLYVYGKNESSDWKVIARKLDGSGENGLNGIYLDDSYFPYNLTTIAICSNSDSQYCDHKIDWVKFRTDAVPDVSICPSGEWSGEVLFGEWNGDAGVVTNNYTVKTDGLSCNIPGGEGKDTGGCMVTRIYREQNVDGPIPDYIAANNRQGFFNYSIEKIEDAIGIGPLEKACVKGTDTDDWINYTNEINIEEKGIGLVYSPEENIEINSTYYELSTRHKYGECISLGCGCYKEPVQRKCLDTTMDSNSYVCARISYDFGEWKLRVYGRYCCPKGMYWDGEEGKCSDVSTT